MLCKLNGHEILPADGDIHWSQATALNTCCAEQPASSRTIAIKGMRRGYTK